ncbi:MAG TPA: hypothetical protein VJP88_04215 [Caulobacteraceae bacterium]|nr:hypothetical protein [Caulobacteraceae bacterium]
MPISQDILYGDSTTPLADHDRAGDQQLANFPEIVGDAPAIGGQAAGGADTLTAPGAGTPFLIGDALTIAGHGQGGDDVFLVAPGASVTETAYGDAETMSGHAHGGADQITVAGGFDAVGYGDAFLMTDHAIGGNDVLTGFVSGRGQPVLYGDAQTMSGHAQGGDDTLTAQAGSGGVMYGDAYTLKDRAHGGDDLLVGAPNLTGADPYHPNNRMYGDGQELLGDAHAGNDTLVSGLGSPDLMWGDAAVVGPNAVRGDNLFVFAPQNGHDQIMDFQPGKDRIELEGFGFGGFNDVAKLFQTTADGTLISLDANDDILLRGVAAKQLSPHDFIFA